MHYLQCVTQCNDKYFGVPWVTGGAAGGGAVSGNLAIFPVGVHGKVNSNPYLINGAQRLALFVGAHCACAPTASTQQLLDFDFYPFERNLVATATRDPIVKVRATTRPASP